MSDLRRIAALAASATPLLAVAACGGVAGTTTTQLHATGSPGSLVAGAIVTAGVDGSTAWAVAANGVAESVDAGATWVADSYPQGVAALDVLASHVGPTGRTVLVTGSADGAKVYRQDAPGLAWSATDLPFSDPSGVSGESRSPGLARLSFGPAGLVAVTGVRMEGHDTAIDNLFVSSDSGATFVERPARLDEPWSAVTFVSADDAVAVLGVRSERLEYSIDGGVSWSPSITSAPSGTLTSYGDPRVVGSSVSITAATQPDSGQDTFAVYSSTDQGHTFSAITKPPLSLTDDRLVGVTASNGPTIWAFSPAGTILESDDSGAKWSTVTATGLPANIDGATLASATSGVIYSATSSCPDKTACTSTVTFYFTVDGGKIWRPAHRGSARKSWSGGSTTAWTARTVRDRLRASVAWSRSPTERTRPQ